MRRLVHRSWTLGALLLALAGCGRGGSGEWIDTPMLDCSELETNRAQIEANIHGTIGPGMCLRAGELTYAGEYRCQGDKVQVLCQKR